MLLFVHMETRRSMQSEALFEAALGVSSPWYVHGTHELAAVQADSTEAGDGIAGGRVE